jgi:hypothetical protein
MDPQRLPEMGLAADVVVVARDVGRFVGQDPSTGLDHTADDRTIANRLVSAYSNAQAMSCR